MSAARTHPGAAIPAALSALVILGGTILSFNSQYFVDYETSLLPWLVGRGWVLYRDAVDQHSPLLPLLLSGAGMGDPAALHYVIVALHLLTLLMGCVVAWRMSGPLAGLVVVVLVELWSVPFGATHLWYDGVLAPFYLGMVILLLYMRPSWSPLLSGLLLGLLVSAATLIKQHALLALPFVAYALIVQVRTGRALRLGGLVAGFLLPVLAAGLYYATQGALGDALYWTVLFSFTSDYSGLSALSPGSAEWPVLLGLYIPVIAALVAWWLDKSDAARWHWPFLLGLVLVATLPAFPRYGRFHLAAAVPLLAVLAGVVSVKLGSLLLDRSSRLRFAAAFGLLPVILSLVIGVDQWLHSLNFVLVTGPPEAPYERTVGNLRAWVDEHVPADAAITINGLDPLLYRVLEREPARPFAPQLPWIDAVPGVTARVWSGIEAANPRVALVSSPGWAASPAPGDYSFEARLRANYQEAARFDVTIYPGAQPVEVVCLLRMDNGSH